MRHRLSSKQQTPRAAMALTAIEPAIMRQKKRHFRAISCGKRTVYYLRYVIMVSNIGTEKPCQPKESLNSKLRRRARQRRAPWPDCSGKQPGSWPSGPLGADPVERSRRAARWPEEKVRPALGMAGIGVATVALCGFSVAMFCVISSYAMVDHRINRKNTAAEGASAPKRGPLLPVKILIPLCEPVKAFLQHDLGLIARERVQL